MPIVADREPDRSATVARPHESSTAPTIEGPLLRWLRAQFLALPHAPGAIRPVSPQDSSHENLAN